MHITFYIKNSVALTEQLKMREKHQRKSMFICYIVLIILIIRRYETLFKWSHMQSTAHSEMCSLLLTHPSTRSLVLGAVGSCCTAPGELWGLSAALLKGTTAGQEVNWDFSE